MNLKTKEIYKIVELCNKGNSHAQKELFIRFSPRVKTMCRRYLKGEAVKDAFQDCFIQIFQSLNNYNVDQGKFEGWMFKVCQRTIFKSAKKEWFVQSTLMNELKEDNIEIEEDVFGKLTNDEIIEEIQNLPEGFKMILNLYVFEQKSHSEIAVLLNIATSSSRSQLTRARKLLKKNLEVKNKNNYVKNSI